MNHPSNHTSLEVSNVSPSRSLQIDELVVHIYASADEVALAASHQAQKILQTALAERGEANVVFATGRSQKNCLQHLTDPNHTSLDWTRITGFHLDEYLGIAADHPASFRHYLKHHLTSRVSMQHFYEIEGDGLLPLDICQRYEQALRSKALDLSFLGIGANGHLAFNDPAVANFKDPQWVKLVRLDETNRQQQLNSTAFDTLAAVPQYAFTLTLSAICNIRQNLCLAFGEGKASIVKTLLTGDITHKCPASILRQISQATLLLDEEAASFL
ncbi:MAG: glucosamine-6-phosphate deaminase [Cyanobacteria bacterium J06649_4]